MHSCDAIGYLASGLALAAFGMKDIARLRIVAICSNIVFLAYGLSLGLAPVWVLHAILLPLNCWGLAQVLETDWTSRPVIAWLRQIGRVRRKRSSAITSPETVA